MNYNQSNSTMSEWLEQWVSEQQQDSTIRWDDEIEQLLLVLEDNLSNLELTVKELATGLRMSRRLVDRGSKRLLDLPPAI